ncbi:MAG: PKD domain-containing protein [Candidatus Sulfotelmatobacter sp.]
MHTTPRLWFALIAVMIVVTCVLSVVPQNSALAAASTAKIENSKLAIEADQKAGTYTIRSKENPRDWLTGAVAAQVNHRWLRSADYGQHEIRESPFSDDLGTGSQLTITYSGFSGQPELVCSVRLRAESIFAEIELQVRNTTGAEITVQSIRMLDAKSPLLALDGPVSSDRVLSDSFSEDRPNMVIHDLVQHDPAQPTDGMHRAVGSQLIYNRQSRQSLFLGALTSEKWLTVLRLRVDEKQPGVTSYEVDSTGTTELAKENSLRTSPQQDQIELSLPVEPGQSLASEKLVASLSSDYHAQLEAYGEVIRRLHAPRVTAATPIGWWSWTAYYFGLTEGPALTNAEFLAAHLKDSGYNFFHIDEGYQYARGDYTTPVSNKYPHGIKKLEEKVQALGLTPGIWTAPFEVSERSSVFLDHKDWLVHNAQGQPIHAGWVTEPPDTPTNLDQLYVLDSTNPGAQQYLRETYRTLTREWGVRYIKLDFMDDTAIEGYYYVPHTTALQAQRTGLQIIREAVGDGVLLDKDGSVMLNPVGLVDTGRISCDTGHSFEASRDAAPGIAARYYMNRNFFISDPDAFSVSRQESAGEQDHGGPKPLTLAEAQVAIALAAVSGGMFEIGDDLPTLFLDADHMALLQNRDLLNMALWGRAAKPLDLMSYTPDDEMPSVFLLRESKRQSILAVFNWTSKEREHEFSFSELFSDPQLATHNRVSDVFGSGASIAENRPSLPLKMASHSVRMVKIVDTSIPASAPSISLHIAEKIATGKPAAFSAESSADSVPALSYRWDFGDGTSAEGASVTHAYTHTGGFTAHLKAEGIEGVPFEKSFQVSVTGTINTHFRPDLYQRYTEQP